MIPGPGGHDLSRNEKSASQLTEPPTFLLFFFNMATRKFKNTCVTWTIFLLGEITCSYFTWSEIITELTHITYITIVWLKLCNHYATFCNLCTVLLFPFFLFSFGFSVAISENPSHQSAHANFLGMMEVGGAVWGLVFGPHRAQDGLRRPSTTEGQSPSLLASRSTFWLCRKEEKRSVGVTDLGLGNRMAHKGFSDFQRH